MKPKLIPFILALSCCASTYAMDLTLSLTRLFDSDLKLLQASKDNNIDDVVEVLKKKPKLETTDAEGCTPLFFAAANNNAPIAALLLQKGARADVPTKDGRTPLLEAIRHHNNSLAFLLIESHAALNAQGSFQKAPLIEAIRRNNAELALYLLWKQVNVCIHDATGKTPLLLALNHIKERPEFVKVALELMSAGDDVNAMDENQWTPLLLAARYNHSALAMTLLEKKALVNVKNKAGWTPLLYAAYNDNKVLALKLLDAGAHHLVSADLLPEANDADLENQLVKVDAPENQPRKQEVWTPFLLAARNSDTDFVLALVAKGGVLADKLSTGVTALHLVVAANNGKLVRRLADVMDAKVADNDGLTPLHYACRYGLEALINPLVKRGADINAMDKKGQTPLHTAVDCEHVDTVKTLLRVQGIDIDRKDIFGCTPLQNAVELPHRKLTRLLLSEGANPGQITKRGLPLSEVAKAHGYMDIWQLIVEFSRIDEIMNLPASSREPSSVAK